MVDNYFVYTRIRDLSKTGSSGYQTLDQYNGDAKQVSLSLAETLSKFYEVVGAVADALGPLIKLANPAVTVSSGGIIAAFPDDYIHLTNIGAVINAKAVAFNKINRNEVDMINSSEVRRPSLAKNNLVYYHEDGTVKLLPAQSYTTNFRYIRKPVTPVLALTDVTGEPGSDYQTLNAGATVNFEFGSSVTDLIIYLMLEKLGVQMKEQIVTEYANIGITRAMLSENTQQ